MVTLDEVAQHAGVSTATASRALSRPDLVAEKTRNRILSAVKELGYSPNQTARSLRQNATRTLGLIISDILVPFHAEVAKGVEDYASNQGYSTLLCNSDESILREREDLELLRRFPVQGLILEPTGGDLANIEAFVKADIPVVEVDRLSGAEGVIKVISDNVQGAADATRYLLDLGHRDIAVIAGNLRLTSGQERLEGVTRTLRAAGITLPPEWIVTGLNTAEDGARGARALFADAKRKPTAVIAVNFMMTAGALLVLRELGLSIPNDVSVIGFDDSPVATLLDPPLTVVAQSAYEMGRSAAKLIIEQIETGSALKPASSMVRFPMRLIVRQSCRARI